MSKRHNRKHNKPRDARKRTATASAGSGKENPHPRGIQTRQRSP